jgi:hypothetical protein
MVNVSVVVTLDLAESVTWTGNVNVPVSAGVPDMVPVALSERVVGKPVPTAHVYGGDPPVAARVWL